MRAVALLPLTYAMQISETDKDQRECYKASDIDRYTTIKTEGPRYYRVREFRS